MQHSVYGLRLQADEAIPGLEPLPASAPTDIRLWLGAMPPSVAEMRKLGGDAWYLSPHRHEGSTPTLTVWKLFGGAYFLFQYCDNTEFLVDRAGTRIWSAWPPAATLEDTATYLLGPILGFVLCLRGVVCLHASAIAVGERAIALAGPARAGKSTTAAAFAKRGYPVLSDDVVALLEQGSVMRVQPGYPCLRLWPDSVNCLYGSEKALPRLTPPDGINAWWDKRYLDLKGNGYRFQQQPLPLAAVYFLAERSADPRAPCVEGLSAQAGLVALVANTYMNYLLDTAMRAQQLPSLARMAGGLPLRLVRPPEDPACLTRVCDAILDDFRMLQPSN